MASSSSKNEEELSAFEAYVRGKLLSIIFRYGVAEIQHSNRAKLQILSSFSNEKPSVFLVFHQEKRIVCFTYDYSHQEDESYRFTLNSAYAYPQFLSESATIQELNNPFCILDPRNNLPSVTSEDNLLSDLKLDYPATPLGMNLDEIKFLTLGTTTTAMSLIDGTEPIYPQINGTWKIGTVENHGARWLILTSDCLQFYCPTVSDRERVRKYFIKSAEIKVTTDLPPQTPLQILPSATPSSLSTSITTSSGVTLSAGISSNQIHWIDGSIRVDYTQSTRRLHERVWMSYSSHVDPEAQLNWNLINSYNFHPLESFQDFLYRIVKVTPLLRVHALPACAWGFEKPIWLEWKLPEMTTVVTINLQVSMNLVGVSSDDVQFLVPPGEVNVPSLKARFSYDLSDPESPTISYLE